MFKKKYLCATRMPCHAILFLRCRGMINVDDNFVGKKNSDVPLFYPDGKSRRGCALWEEKYKSWELDETKQTQPSQANQPAQERKEEKGGIESRTQTPNPGTKPKKKQIMLKIKRPAMLFPAGPPPSKIRGAREGGGWAGGVKKRHPQDEERKNPFETPG